MDCKYWRCSNLTFNKKIVFMLQLILPRLFLKIAGSIGEGEFGFPQPLNFSIEDGFDNETWYMTRSLS